MDNLRGPLTRCEAPLTHTLQVQGPRGPPCRHQLVRRRRGADHRVVRGDQRRRGGGGGRRRRRRWRRQHGVPRPRREHQPTGTPSEGEFPGAPRPAPHCNKAQAAEAEKEPPGGGPITVATLATLSSGASRNLESFPRATQQPPAALRRRFSVITGGASNNRAPPPSPPKAVGPRRTPRRTPSPPITTPPAPVLPSAPWVCPPQNGGGDRARRGPPTPRTLTLGSGPTGETQPGGGRANRAHVPALLPRGAAPAPHGRPSIPAGSPPSGARCGGRKRAAITSRCSTSGHRRSSSQRARRSTKRRLDHPASGWGAAGKPPPREDLHRHTPPRPSPLHPDNLPEPSRRVPLPLPAIELAHRPDRAPLHQPRRRRLGRPVDAGARAGAGRRA